MPRRPEHPESAYCAGMAACLVIFGAFQLVPSFISSVVYPSYTGKAVVLVSTGTQVK